VGSARTLLYACVHECCNENFLSELEDRLQPPPLTHGSFMFEEMDLSQDSVHKAFRKAFFTPFFFTSSVSYSRTSASLFVAIFCLLHYENVTICVTATGVTLFNNNYLKRIFCKIIF